MITNERQYKISRSQAEKFKAAIESFNVGDVVNGGVHPILVQAQLEQLQSEYDNLIEQIEEYDRLKSGEEIEFEAHSLQELPLVLIKARIARNFTQKQLAENLGLKEQQIQRYESDFYRSANFKTLAKVADVLGLNISEKANLYSVEETFIDFHKKIPFKEIYRRGWFEDFSGSIVDALKESDKLIEGIFIKAGIAENQIALHRKKLRVDSSLNENALLIWQARIISLCQNQKLYQSFDEDRLTPEWFRELAKLSQYDEGPALARDWLLESGIYFVVEQHLPQTYLDGAAIQHPDGSPIVAVTLRQDRLDNFWFVLFHELAHIKLHFPAKTYSDFFDNSDIESNDIEKEADEFALNSLIPETKWEGCLSRFSLNDEMVREEAKQLQIHPAIVAGRIRHERKNYYILNDAIGQHEVRKCFEKGFLNYDLFS